MIAERFFAILLNLIHLHSLTHVHKPVHLLQQNFPSTHTKEYSKSHPPHTQRIVHKGKLYPRGSYMRIIHERIAHSRTHKPQPPETSGSICCYHVWFNSYSCMATWRLQVNKEHNTKVSSMVRSVITHQYGHPHILLVYHVLSKPAPEMWGYLCQRLLLETLY